MTYSSKVLILSFFSIIILNLPFLSLATASIAKALGKWVVIDFELCDLKNTPGLKDAIYTRDKRIPVF